MSFYGGENNIKLYSNQESILIKWIYSSPVKSFVA